MDYYTILEINHTASKEEIKKAYKKLVLKYHPDKNTNKESHNKFIDINTAYNILIDDNKRKEYDKLETEDKIELYNYLKNNILSKYGLYNNILNILEELYGKEDFINDVNNFNIKKLYNNFIDKLNNIKYTDLINNEPQDIYENCYISLKDRYLNIKKKVIIKNDNNEENIYNISILKDEYRIINEGINGGDLIINIICNEEEEIKQIDEVNLLLIKEITLYEYLYGGSFELEYFDGEHINIKYSNFIEDIPLLQFENKGLLKNDIDRGDLFIYFKIKGITGNYDKEYYDYVKNNIHKLFNN